MNQATYLIVEQQHRPAEELPELLKELAQQHRLDIYQCRQRLLGSGLSLLCKGPLEAQQKISGRLQQAAFRHWLVEPSKPRFVPRRIRSLQVDSDKIIFSCHKKQVVFPKGGIVLAVLAEMSGTLADKSVQQLLSSHAYRGRDNIRHLESHKIRKTILQGKPLLDLYLLDGQKQIVDAVRIFPGKFDPQGLGDRATVSSVQNLERIVQLAEEYAGEFKLVSDFGLVNLPGCSLRRGNPNDLETERQNQLSLARYGWLLADLERVGAVEPATQREPASEPVVHISTAILTRNPELQAATQAENVQPAAEELARQIASEDHHTETPSPAIAEEGLPAPPPAQKLQAWRNPRFWFGTAGAAVLAGGLFVLENYRAGSFGHFARQAFDSGALPFLFCALLLCCGFYFVRLKRQIENTPTSKIRSVAMGMVEVKGSAVRQYALLAPMSHIPCVYYRLTKYRRDSDNGRDWKVTSISSSNAVPFLLEDETGRVEIDPAGCRVSAGTKHEGTPGQVGLMPLTAGSDEKWVEEIIIEGTLIYVLGFASVKRSSGPTLTERKIEALRELKRNPQDLHQFDSDGDGRISEDEWDNARAAVTDKILHDELQKKQRRKKQEEHIVIGKKAGRPLVIAETHSEEHLTRRYGSYSVGFFILAAGALGWGINNLLNYLT